MRGCLFPPHQNGSSVLNLAATSPPSGTRADVTIMTRFYDLALEKVQGIAGIAVSYYPRVYLSEVIVRLRVVFHFLLTLCTPKNWHKNARSVSNAIPSSF